MMGDIPGAGLKADWKVGRLTFVLLTGPGPGLMWSLRTGVVLVTL